MVRTLDLFCGAGGSSWGAKAAGASIVCGVDADELASEAYGFNFGKSAATCVKLNEGSGPGDFQNLGKIDLLLASPECTHHTCARGNKPRDENSRRTANYVIRFAEELCPRWVIIENVVHMKSWDGYESVINGLKALGYNVSPQVLNASSFGVPQNRRRLFLIADRDQPVPNIIGDAGEPAAARTILDPSGTWRSRPLHRTGRAQGTLDRANRAIAALGEGVDFLIVYYGSDGSGGWQKLDQPLRTMTTLDRFGLVTWEDGKPMLRMLQVPELRRAMGFTSDFQLAGRRRDQIRLLGNGVCPPVMQAIVDQICFSETYAVAAE